MTAPLPASFLAALEGVDEVLASSRDAAGTGTVPVWFVVAPPGVVYLFTHAFSRKAQRWLVDPWVRLRVPESGETTEGRAHVLQPEEVDAVSGIIVGRWDMAGATTPEALRELVRAGTHVVVRVEGA